VAAGVDPWARQAAQWLAVALQRRGAMKEALEVWRRLYRDDPRDLRAARGYAIRLERCGDIAGAVDVCAQVGRVRADLGPWWASMRGGGTLGDVEWNRREVRLRRRLHS
jgi:hypothetical protein